MCVFTWGRRAWRGRWPDADRGSYPENTRPPSPHRTDLRRRQTESFTLWNKHYVRSVAMTLSHLCRWGRTDRCSCPLHPHRWRRSRSRGPGSRPHSPRRTCRGNQTHRHSCRHRIRHIFTKIYCKISHDGASLLAKAFLCHNDPLVLFYANL